MIERATVIAPEMIGLLVWWIVVLAAPVTLVRRWRRRRRVAERLRRQIGRPAPGQLIGPPNPPPSAAAGSKTTTSPVSCLTVPRVAAQALEPLCRFVDFQRRLDLAASELTATLSQLPANRWRIEPYPLTGERRNTFLILGDTGIFVISATYSPGHWDDVIAAGRLASKIQALLPGWGGQVQPAICHPFTRTEPRLWYRPDEHGEWVGAWLVGGDSVIGWLEGFNSAHGLSAAELERFDELATPNWLHGAIPAAPSWPPIRNVGSPDRHE